MEEEGRKETEGDIKRIKLPYVHVPTPHNEYNYYVLQVCTNKNEQKYCLEPNWLEKSWKSELATI